MDLETATNHALEGDAVLFVGAGFSAAALNLKGEPFKKSRELSSMLSHAAGVDDELPLESAAEEFREQFGDDRLIKELQEEFTTSAVSRHHIQIASIPWRRIYTSNYDNVMEFACAKQGTKLVPVAPSDRVHDISKSATLCVHLNGFVDRLTRTSLDHEFKLLDTAYLSSSLADSPWLSLFRRDLANARSVFVIGYALSDLDISRVLFSTDSLRKKCIVAVGQTPIRALSKKADKFGDVVSQDAEDVAKAMSRVQQHFVPRDLGDRGTRSLAKFQLPAETVSPRDADVLNLLLLGDVQSGFVWQSLQGGTRYFLKRSIGSQVMSAIENGSRATVLHSELGNGKSLVLEGLRFDALQRGYDVYSLTTSVDSVDADIRVIRGKGRKALIIVDNYSEVLEPLRQMAVEAPDNTSFALAARSVIHDVVIDDLEDIFATGVTEISLDVLSQDDLEWIAKLFDEHGLWGKDAGRSTRFKRDVLETECRSQFHQILLRVLQASQMHTRLMQIEGELKSNSAYNRIVVSALIAAVVGYPTTADFLCDVWGTDVLRSREFRKNPVVLQLVNFESGQITMRSAVVSRYIVKNIVSPIATAETLIEVAKALDRSSSVVHWHRALLSRTMRFSTLQELLPESSGKLAAVLQFYESAKNLVFCRQNPLFWLQYAIATLALDQIDRSERYFETAYSFAARRSFSAYQIDNHYARFLLTKAIRKSESDTCMDSFRKARTIVNEQMGRERHHYPYRVAKLYFDFFERFAPSLKSEHREEIIRAASYVLEKIESLPELRKRHRNVVDCKKAMESILSARQGVATS